MRYYHLFASLVHLPLVLCKVGSENEAVTILQPHEVFNSRNLRKEEAKIYGVNIGGWLLSEPWITPSLYEDVERRHGRIPVDEHQLCTIMGPTEAEAHLTHHWDTFYSEQDFEEIAKLQLNLVRIPIGYWAFGLLPDDPYVQGQEHYLDMAISWAAKYNLQVQIGLHGMPGSQNGFDNSGLRTEHPGWFDKEENMVLTYRVVEYVVDKYGNHPAVHSINLVNEPHGWLLDRSKILEFYKYGIDLFERRQVSAKLCLHDAFLNMDDWRGLQGDFILDHHLYECFSNAQIDMNIDEHLRRVKQQSELLPHTGHYSVVGEFSGALNDCTKYLNGVNRGTRWEGTFDSNDGGGGGASTRRSCDNMDNPNSDEHRAEVMIFLREQFYDYEEMGNGWIFWCWKTESSLVWDMRRLWAKNMLPRPLIRDPVPLKDIKKLAVSKPKILESKNDAGAGAGATGVVTTAFKIFGAILVELFVCFM
ncbi:uncharacterized protein LODBEIA_P25080 [Lodderomyces beijingensis]|uniref:glucan 1,3-beta-glucosidase n=1 Tax=Lodderomyces beijingensis TaxID=1775926 RepID=A0ABP0ZK85_9ASCO